MPRPNIIVILADDLSWHDLGVMGAGDMKTPHIDSLASHGVLFSAGYVTAPVCSPSRAALLTGRYQQRFGHEANPGTDLERNPFFGLPFLMQWLGHLPANKVFAAPVSTLDILPTAVAAAGGIVPMAWQLDGVNLLPYLLEQSNGVPHPSLFWRVETDGIPGGDVKDGVRAARQDNWKLVKQTIHDTWELYDLDEDMGETNNLALARPEMVQQLVSAYDDWSAQLARPRWARDNLTYKTPEFVVEDIRIGANGISYLLPEFLPGGAMMAFQDSENNLWRGELDPLTGFLRSGHGRDQPVAAGLTPADGIVDGAAWGLSTNRVALYYTKPGATGGRQVWRALIAPGPSAGTQLTTNVFFESFGVRVSQEPASASVKLVFNAGNSVNSATAWADENRPWSISALPRQAPGFSNGRWIPASDDLAYSASPPGKFTTQVARYFTLGGTNAFISDDGGDKTDVCGFLAPEYGGELCYAAVVDRTAIALYRDLRDKPTGAYTRVATLTFPSNAPNRFISSMEPLQGLRGFNGVSYFSCATYQNDDPLNPGDTAIWMIGLGPATNSPIARRVDDGALLNATRRNPKTFIGEREVYCYYSLHAGANPVQLHLAKTGIRRPEFQGPAGGFTSLRHNWSFVSGATNAIGQVVGGTETMALVNHQGRLFAGTGSRLDQPYPEVVTNPPPTWSGAQILIKDSPTSPWRVDPAMPEIFRAHLRVETLVDFTFTTRSDGTRLPSPVNLLIAGLSDIGASGATLASARTRRDNNSNWDHSNIATTTGPANTVSLGLHVDRSNGVHTIFAGLQNGEIYRGAYNESASGKLAWASNSVELTNQGPITAFAEANGLLYASCGLRQAGKFKSINGGLFVRKDSNVVWQLVYQWPHPVEVFAAREEDRVARGLTAVPDPFGESYEVLLSARAWPGVIERIDPWQRHAVTIELDVRDFFARLWNDDRVRQASVTMGYTGFTPATNPVTGERVHLVGVWVNHPDSSSPPFNGSHFLVRHRNGTYEPAETANFTPPLPPGQSLRSTRCLAVSPFVEDGGNAFYFGGYDTADNVSKNTAWIMRGDWSEWPSLAITQPNPPDWQLTWPIAATNWLLETSAAIDSRANWELVPGRSTRSLTNEAQSVSPQGPNGFYRLRKPW